MRKQKIAYNVNKCMVGFVKMDTCWWLGMGIDVCVSWMVGLVLGIGGEGGGGRFGHIFIPSVSYVWGYGPGGRLGNNRSDVFAILT